MIYKIVYAYRSELDDNRQRTCSVLVQATCLLEAIGNVMVTYNLMQDQILTASMARTPILDRREVTMYPR